MCTSLTISVPTVYVKIGDCIGEEHFALWLYPIIVSNQQAVTFIEIDQTTERTKCLIKKCMIQIIRPFNILSIFCVERKHRRGGEVIREKETIEFMFFPMCICSLRLASEV